MYATVLWMRVLEHVEQAYSGLIPNDMSKFKLFYSSLKSTFGVLGLMNLKRLVLRRILIIELYGVDCNNELQPVT